jgi:toxin ParE1/3/4
MSHADWAPQAKADLHDIYLWIARRDGRRSTARRIVREIRQECNRYANAFAAGSLLGTASSELGESARNFTHKRWVVVFRPVDEGIEVLRVVDGSRDFPRLFGE